MEDSYTDIRILGGSPTDVQFSDKGHDCPVEPNYNPDVGMWRCSCCDWTLHITTEDCHICGHPAEDPPHPLPRDQFLSFPDPIHKRVLSMHISCAVQVYLTLRMDLGEEDNEKDGGSIL